jgi:hypothetical protein
MCLSGSQKTYLCLDDGQQRLETVVDRARDKFLGDICRSYDGKSCRRR